MPVTCTTKSFNSMLRASDVRHTIWSSCPLTTRLAKHKSVLNFVDAPIPVTEAARSEPGCCVYLRRVVSTAGSLAQSAIFTSVIEREIAGDCKINVLGARLREIETRVWLNLLTPSGLPLRDPPSVDVPSTRRCSDLLTGSATAACATGAYRSAGHNEPYARRAALHDPSGVSRSFRLVGVSPWRAPRA